MSLNVIGIGEVLWDMLPAGRQMGGAPANFAFHCLTLGANAGVLTRVGDDANGAEIRRRFAAMGLPAGLMQVDSAAPTGTVTVALSSSGVPRYMIQENVAWDRIEMTDAAVRAVQDADALCFGTLAQRSSQSRETIQRLVAAAPAHCLRVFDVNLRQNFHSPEVIRQSLRLANVVKLNDEELPVIAGMLRLAGSQKEQMARLAADFGLKLLALTRGAEGSLIFQEGRWSEEFPRPVRVVDTVGAGDAFTAALVMGLLLRMDLDAVHAWAAKAARFVCSCAGATPGLPEEIRTGFKGGGELG